MTRILRAPLLSAAQPLIGDEVDLILSAPFEKQ